MVASVVINFVCHGLFVAAFCGGNIDSPVRNSLGFGFLIYNALLCIQ